MKNKNYVHKTITLKCDLCEETLRVRKSELNDFQINAIYNHDECLCRSCLRKSPKSFDDKFITYHYGIIKTFIIFPKTISLDDIKKHKQNMESAKRLSNALLSDDFGKQLKIGYIKCQMAAKNLTIVK